MDGIKEAFRQTPRYNFVLPEQLGLADLDAPLPIGFGQTISQPTTVRLMLEWLDVESGHKILDVGAGSGWTAALLANLTGAVGQVYAVEAVPELLKFGRQNCQRLGLKNIEFHQAGRHYGLPRTAPYDRILVSAAAGEPPEELFAQLKTGGKMVIPVADDILEITRSSDDTIEEFVHPGFSFVPLVRL